MKVTSVYIRGKTKEDLIYALEHAINQIDLGTKSENMTYEDGTHVDYTIMEKPDSEFELG